MRLIRGYRENRISDKLETIKLGISNFDNFYLCCVKGRKEKKYLILPEYTGFQKSLAVR